MWIERAYDVNQASVHVLCIIGLIMNSVIYIHLEIMNWKEFLSTKVSVLLKIDVTYEMLWYQIKKTKQHQIDFY